MDVPFSLRRRYPAMVYIGGGMVAVLALVALLAGALAPQDPTFQNPRGITAQGMPVPPGPQFPLGADSLGRDMLSRLLHGARISLLIGVVGTLIALGIGGIAGIVAGYFGGVWDTLIMRATDIMMCFPSLLLAIALVSVLKPGLSNIFLVIGLVYWTGNARVIRGETLALREKDFIAAARAIGASEARILLCHILPNLTPTLIILASLGVANTVLLDAGLSFLGIGVPPPTPSWGTMIAEGQNFFRTAPWMMLYPGLAVLLTVTGFNLLGDGLRDWLDPRQPGRPG
ncbi:MAG: ABC transporter permease [Armatimonadetes bacterium]|nr:ABC transporter permease [Armatimonadota bacterium]